ncbi:DUF3261 domain-containing protein [Francisellaceae bacterium]|nr:DUF3261 domain-containing protein [Francisellaceae bacterium]
MLNLHKYYLKQWVFILVALSLTSCAFLRTHDNDSPKIKVFKNQWIQLPTPQALGLNVSATQILSATYGKKTYSAQVQVEVTPQHIILVALGGWGSELFSIDYNGETIKNSHLPMPNAQMGIQHTLTDFIFTYASPTLLRQTLSSSKITFTVSPRQRVFSLNGKPIIQINYQYTDPWKGKVTLKNIALGYQVNIKTIALKQNQ